VFTYTSLIIVLDPVTGGELAARTKLLWTSVS